MSGWKEIDGLEAGFAATTLVQDVARPDVVHIGSEQGYFRSEDGGGSVRRRGDKTSPDGAPLNLLGLLACPAAPKRLYGALSGGRVALSDDGQGAKWRATAMRGMSEFRPDGWALAGDPTDAGKLYLLNPYRDGLWYSADSGESWTRQMRGLRGVFLQASCPGPALVVTQRGVKVGALADGRVVRIAPGQDSWRVLGKREIGTQYMASVCTDPHHPSRLWRTARGRLFRSDDGLRWMKLGPDAASFVVCDQGKPGRMAILREGGRVALSLDAGATWRDLEPLPQRLYVAAFAGNSLVVLPDKSLFRTDL